MTPVHAIDRLAEDLYSLVERHWKIVFWGLSAIYLVGTSARAYTRPFNYDEIFSSYVARLPGVGAIWSALQAGMDTNPPLSFVLIRASQGAFGAGELSTRLPSIVSIWLVLACVFTFVTRRCGSVFGLLAMLVLCGTTAYDRAFEARAYAVVLGCCAVALLCWQAAAEGRHRPGALLGLGVSLGAASWSHYFAILVFLPLVAGEALRGWRRRRVDWPIWLAMGLGGASLFPLLALIGAIRGYAATFGAPPSMATVVEAYTSYFDGGGRTILLLVVWLGGLGLLELFDRVRASDQASGDGPPEEELLAALVLMLTPVTGLALAKIAGGVLHTRYVLPGVIGVTILLVFALWRLMPRRAWIPVSLMVAVSLFVVRQGINVQSLLRGDSPGSVVRPLLEASEAQRAAAIVVADALDFLVLHHYAPAALRDRLHYLTDRQAAVRHTGRNIVEWNLQELTKRFPLPVSDYRAFVSAYERFLIYGDERWLVPKLLEDGVRLQVREPWSWRTATC